MASRSPWWQIAQSAAWGFRAGAIFGAVALACWLAVGFDAGFRNLPFMVAAAVLTLGSGVYFAQAIYLRRQ